MCKKDFFMTEMIGELPCEDRHIFHKDCINLWFNTQHHLNCPICLEYILGRKKAYF